MLYLRQTKNELTGEHSSIMVRALPKVSGVDGTWIDAFVGDTKRRFLSLLGGPFRGLSIRLAVAVVESMPKKAKSKDGDLISRSGDMPDMLTETELGYMLTQHDLKRIELYGRNLCDHHLVTDLLPALARMYFIGRFGASMKLSSVQGAILLGLGLQNRNVDSMSKELSLPASQVLAMFNKAVRKMSIALNLIVEAKEKEALLGGKERLKAQQTVHRMRNVALETLEEDAEKAAKAAMSNLSQTR